MPTQQYPYTTSGNYTFDSAKIEVTGGLAKLKDLGGGTYDTGKPTIQPASILNPFGVKTWDGFTETLGGGNQGSVEYQLSKDQGNTWYYYDGSRWVATTTQSNPIATVNSNIGTFSAKTFQWTEQNGGLELGIESMAETYYAAPVQRQPLGQNETGHINKAKFVIGDRGFELTKDILADPSILKGAKVVIRRSAVGLDLTDSASFRLVFRGYINTATAESKKGAIAIEITERVRDWSRPLAKRRYSKVCGFKFKEPNSCKYAGAETFCDKTYTACQGYSNTDNFGGFPELTDLQFRGL